MASRTLRKVRPRLAPAYVYRASLVRVIDGDTFIMRVDLGFRVFAELAVRLRDYSARELNEGGGAADRDKATAALTAAKEITLQSYKDRQSFARWIADIYVDGKALAAVLART